ncbi:MAG: hypothetical protein KatS3mg108_3170 [Isosphaeraceae bacterium]|nr:MAG: hypothetical protein KatS3mg108_3170 [Isosphaeraceae bacterium]
MNRREQGIERLDQILSGIVVAMVGGTIVAFGGQVWWYPPVLATLATAAVVVWLVRSALAGGIGFLRSPLTALGLLIVGLGIVQNLPLPGRLAWLSPRSSIAADPEASSAQPWVVSLDRPATLRWTLAALTCVVLAVVVAHHVDRAGRLRLVWGAVIAGFGVGTLSGLLQLAAHAPGVYGIVAPESGPWWGPSMNERLAGPHVARWRALAPAGRPESEQMVPRIEPAYAIGPHVAGPGGQLALGSLALPLVLALVAQALAPRGSREPLVVRVRQDGSGPWIGLAIPFYLAGAGLQGYLGGALLAIPVALGLALVAGGSSWRTGNARAALILGGAGLLALGVGLALGSWLGRPPGSPWLAVGRHREELAELWKGAWKTGWEYRWLGVGLGAFGALIPQIKLFDAASETASSALLQWWAETGLAGLAILLAGVVWVGMALAGAWRRVGQADRALAAGLIGALVAFAGFSALHWTVQGLAISLAAAAVFGTAHRWLAGGTDLFVESVGYDVLSGALRELNPGLRARTD